MGLVDFSWLKWSPTQIGVQSLPPTARSLGTWGESKQSNHVKSIKINTPPSANWMLQKNHPLRQQWLAALSLPRPSNSLRANMLELFHCRQLSKAYQLTYQHHNPGT